MMKKRDGFYILISLPAILILIILFAIPMFFIFQRAFENNSEALIEVFRDEYSYRLLSFTIIQAFLSATISVLIALPFSAFFSKYRFPLRKAILTLSEVAFTIPSILVVLAFVIWYGNAGILNTLLMKLFTLDEPPLRILYSYKAIIFAHVYLNFPIAFSLITSAWSNMSEREEQASLSMGKTKSKTFFSVTLPKIRGSIIAAFILIFLFCFSSFSIVLVLGGKPQYYTLEAEIYKRTYTELNPGSAAALSLFSTFFTFILLIITSGRRKNTKATKSKKELQKVKGKSAILAFFIVLIILLFLIPPILSIVYRAFFTKSGEFTTRAWEDILYSRNSIISSSLMAVVNSFLIALISALLSTFFASRLALMSAKTGSKLISSLASLPMATGSVTLGLGFAFLSSRIQNSSIVLSYILVILSHLVISIPFAIRTILPEAGKIPVTIGLSSYTLGQGKHKTLRCVELPMLFYARKKAFAFAFSLSLGEVNATLTLAQGSVVTLPILIYRMINSYNYQGAAALGTILLSEAFIVFLIAEIGGKRDVIS